MWARRAFVRPVMYPRLLRTPTTIFTKYVTNKSVNLFVRITVKPAYNGTARTGFFSVAGKFRLVHALQVKLKILGSVKAFRQVQVPLCPGSD